MGHGRALEDALHKNALGHLDWVGQPPWDAIIAYLNTKVRSKVEHSFHIMKNLFGYRKTRYRGLEKNEASLYMLFGLASMYRWSWHMKSLGARPVAA